MSHTPGPWEIGRNVNGLFIKGEQDHATVYFAKVLDEDDDISLPQAANAALIVQAPRMYEFIKKLAAANSLRNASDRVAVLADARAIVEQVERGTGARR